MFFCAIISVNASGPARACASARAFTLVELLAAVVGAVVVLSAATGFLLTAFLRQKAVLEAQRLEALHDDLAQTIGTAIKTADAFQIYSGRAQYGAGRLGIGSRTGNFLVCLKTEPDGSQSEADFELSDGQIIYAKTVAGVEQTTRRYPYTRIPPGVVDIFSTDLGIVQASWDVVTRQDLVPFHVCAMPLVMR